MFEGIGNIPEMLKLLGRARVEGPRFAEELKKLVVEGSAGGGMVKVRVNGRQEVLEYKIDPQVFADHDAELLEDLVLSATNQALEKAKVAFAEKLREVAGEINIPALKNLLSQFGGETPKA